MAEGGQLPTQLHSENWNRDGPTAEDAENFGQNFGDDVIVGEDASNGKCRLKNDIYIQIGTGIITSVFYHFDKDGKDIKKDLKTNNCSRFSTKTLIVEGNANELLHLEMNLTEPDIKLSRDRWQPTEATIRKVQEVGLFCFNVSPGGAVRSLTAGSFVDGEYRVFVGSSDKPADSACVAREWPVKLDPEVTADETISDPGTCMLLAASERLIKRVPFRLKLCDEEEIKKEEERLREDKKTNINTSVITDSASFVRDSAVHTLGSSGSKVNIKKDGVTEIVKKL